MAYIKISDPSIVDLSAWHQVINVVNQHSDTLDAITNNFGTTATPQWDSSDYTHTFESGSQQILFGRSKIMDTDTHTDGTLWYNTVTFTSTPGISAFSAQPIVTATVFCGNTSNPVTSSNNDVAVSIYNVSATGFKYRLFRTGTTKAIAGTIWVNWTAIGPR